ncbi:MAG: DHHA1 domain-containing protein [Patescibacteria group bacterium]
MNKKITVLYHNRCDDGFGAAWVAWKKFGDKAEYVGVTHGDPPPRGLRGKEVYILDFCYPKEILKELLKKTKSLTVIDHHISMKDAVESVPRHLFNGSFSHSGSTLAWQYFFSKKKVPKFLLHIEAKDLWKFLPFTKELTAYLRTKEQDFKIWNKLANDWENKSKIKKCIQEGAVILKYENDLVAEAVDDAELVEFLGHKTLAVNSRNRIDNIAEKLYKKKPPISIVWSQRKDKIVVSLRSNGAVDVSKLAARFGGGGHKTAAAFRLEANQKLPWKIVKK